jgi:outer membrane protein assembly factor BamB
MIKILLVLLFLSSSADTFAQYHGKVFIDTNKNGKIDLGERKLPKVRVSDGLNVVLTDDSGSFTIPGHEKTRFLFVTTPAGYKVSLTSYLPVQGNTKAYNFGLVPDSSLAGKRIRMLHISDTETDIYGDWIANVRNFSKTQGAAFVVHTGDICYEKGLNFHASQVNTQQLQKPIHYAMGNHDLVKGPYGEALFESLFGPPYYSFDAGPAHFIITPMASGDFKPDYTTDQLIAWLKNDLKLTDKNKPVFIFNHNLPFREGNFTLKGIKDSIELDKFGLKAWIYGHWHTNFVQKFEKNGIYAICTSALNKGGIDNSAGQFLAIDINEHGIEKIQPRYANIKEQVTIVQPSTNMNVLTNGKLMISANVYDSELPIQSVNVLIYDKFDNKIASQKLKSYGDWNWRAEALVTAKWKGNDFKIAIEVYYTGGSYTIRKQDFQLKPIVSNHTPVLKWSTNIGANIWSAAPIVVDDVLFVGTIDDGQNGESGITALNATTGRLLWRFKTKNSVKHAISYEQDVVLATDMEGIVYALSAKKGELLWKKELGMTYLPGHLTGGISLEGIYYTGFGNYLQALQIKDGKTLWRNTTWEARMGSPAQMTIAGDVLLTGSNWNALFAHDINTGKLLWKRDDQGLRYRSGQPTFKDNLIYVTGMKTLFVLDVYTGVTVRQLSTDYDFKVMAAPLVTDKLIILSTSTNGVIAYDKDSFKMVWNTPVGEALIYSAPYYGPEQLKPVQTVEPTVTENGDKLYVGASDGYFYVLKQKTGEIIVKINLGAPIFAQTTVLNHNSYVAGFDGSIYCFKL